MEYSEEIIDHARNPRNFGDLKGANKRSKQSNATCGDMVEFYAKVDGGVIRDIRFKGVGCALSTAAASMLSEKVKGMKVDEVGELDGKVVVELMGEVNPGRMKCVLLPLSAIRALVG